MDLRWVGDAVDAAPNGGEGARDQVGGALLAHAEHHGRAHVEGVALPLVPPRTPAGNDVPAGQVMRLEEGLSQMPHPFQAGAVACMRSGTWHDAICDSVWLIEHKLGTSGAREASAQRTFRAR